MSDAMQPPRPGRPAGGGEGSGEGQPRGRRRPSPLLLTAVVLVVLFLLLSVFTGVWTEKLWFSSIGYSSVFTTLLWTRVGLAVGFGLLMAVVVGLNLWSAYHFRPGFRPDTYDEANLERYRSVINPLRRVLLIGISLLLGVFAGISATGQWRTFLLWKDRSPFGTTDPFFNKDVGFYFFTLPWLHYLVDFATTALVIGLMAGVLVHYLYGGVRLAGPHRFSGAAQVQVSIVLGVLLLLKAADYWLDRFDLTTDDGGLVTGMTYTRENAVLPAKNILMIIALICALLLFANVFRRTWLLPGVGIALLVLSAVLLGAVWPTIVQRFQVDPSAADKESPYIAKNIDATRAAYDVGSAKISQYDADSTNAPSKLLDDDAAQSRIRLVDPQLVSDTFEQLQQVRGYYSVPSVLDVDQYQIDGRERDLVVAPRELNQDGLPQAQKNWANEKTVYTHGYGMIAAYGNQRPADDGEVQTDGSPVWAEQKLPPVGELSAMTKQGYRPQIYFGEQSPEYSIVGRPKGANPIELDVPQGNTSDASASRTNTYQGKDGVKVGSLFHKLLYAAKFGDSNIVLSSRVNDDSKILYDRSPRQRVQKVAPWLTVDSDALPAVVDGKIVWIMDGYTTSDKYPLSESRSLDEMVSDRLNPRAAYATLPTDHINYMRNAVKATVDAYDGTVTLYAWDESDPVLKTWRKVFPGVVKDRSEIPQDLLAHFRYPQDLFKVQRNILADYHVTNPKTFYEGSDKWDVPQDPEEAQNKQPPYRVTVATSPSAQPTFSLTSVYVPTNRENLASFMTVGADAADPSTYGKFQILRLPDNTQVAGPSQIANQFNSDETVANTLRPFTQSDNARVEFGNLLTLPVENGLLYVQPLYTLRGRGAAPYPQLEFVLASFGDQVGIGKTLEEALQQISTGQAADGDTGSGTGGGTDQTPQTGAGGSGSGSGNGSGNGGGNVQLNAQARQLLQQANTKFQAAQAALQQGNLSQYQDNVNQARTLVQRALGSANQ